MRTRQQVPDDSVPRGATLHAEASALVSPFGIPAVLCETLGATLPAGTGVYSTDVPADVTCLVCRTAIGT